MRLKVVGCSGGNAPGHDLPSFLVNDVLAIDAGSLSGALTLHEQSRVKDVLISHSHLDHTCALPFLIDNNYSVPGFALRIHALPAVVASMRNHLFNNHTWPDFTCLPNDLTPVLKLVVIRTDRPFRVAGLSVKAIPVSHVVPTAGFILDDGNSAIAYSGDTGPTRRFWQAVRRVERLRAVIVETSYPDELLALARLSGHLTPGLLARELDKLQREVPVFLYGAKPRHLTRIRRQVHALGRTDLRFLTPGQILRF